MAELLNKITFGGDATSSSPALANSNDTFMALARTLRDGNNYVEFSMRGESFDDELILGSGDNTGCGFTVRGPVGSEELIVANRTLDQGGPGFVTVYRRSLGPPFSEIKTDVKQAETDFIPAVASLGGYIYLAWTRLDNHLNIAPDPNNFYPPNTLNDTSNSGPSLTVIDGALYLLWQGRDDPPHLNIAEYVPSGKAGGVLTFVGKNTIGQTSDFAPALTRLGDTFVLAWTGRDDAQSLNTLKGTDLFTMSDHSVYTDHSEIGPTLTTFQGEVYIGWEGRDINHFHNIAIVP